MQTLSHTQALALDYLETCRQEMRARVCRMAQLGEHHPDRHALRVAKARVLESIAAVANAKTYAVEIGACV